jgi:thiamine pyrophosphokinase
VRALVVAAGDPPSRLDLDRAWPGWADGIAVVIAADGGSSTAGYLGLGMDLVVGDLDSVDPAQLTALRARGIPIEWAPADKDESDTELAVAAALARGATSIVIVGGFGGRLDHLLANVGLLALAQLTGVPTQLLDESTRVTLIRGGEAPVDREFRGRVGDLVSLLPFGPGVEGVTTIGLAWALDDAALPVGPARGLSNQRTATVARVSVRAGLLLVVETTTLSLGG